MWYKNIKAQNFLVVFLTFLGLGTSLYIVNLTPELSPDEKSEIQEKVFTGVFQHFMQHPQANPDYFFISTLGSDPSSEVIAKFRDHKPAVAPLSKSMIAYGFSAFIVHKEDHSKKGIKVDLDKPVPLADGKVNITATIYQDKITAAHYVFSLRKKKGEYLITSVDYPERKQP